MKRTMVLVIVVLLISTSILSSVALAASAKKGGNSILNGNVFYSAGHYLQGKPIPTGYDSYGYNYQAHMFNGCYANVYLGKDGFPPYTGDDASYLVENPGAASHWAWAYRDIRIVMKWNEAWLSNMDRDGDGLLDRHYGFPSFIGSGAWETNHMPQYFCKIVAAPSDAYIKNDKWYTADGEEIGAVIWGEFAVTQEIDNEYDVKYISPLGPGFGKF